jgi:hypothetical protein
MLNLGQLCSLNAGGGLDPLFLRILGIQQLGFDGHFEQPWLRLNRPNV